MPTLYDLLPEQTKARTPREHLTPKWQQRLLAPVPKEQLHAAAIFAQRLAPKVERMTLGASFKRTEGAPVNAEQADIFNSPEAHRNIVPVTTTDQQPARDPMEKQKFNRDILTAIPTLPGTMGVPPIAGARVVQGAVSFAEPLNFTDKPTRFLPPAETGMEQGLEVAGALVPQLAAAYVGAAGAGALGAGTAVQAAVGGALGSQMQAGTAKQRLRRGLAAGATSAATVPIAKKLVGDWVARQMANRTFSAAGIVALKKQIGAALGAEGYSPEVVAKLLARFEADAVAAAQALSARLGQAGHLGSAAVSGAVGGPLVDVAEQGLGALGLKEQGEDLSITPASAVQNFALEAGLDLMTGGRSHPLPAATSGSVATQTVAERLARRSSAASERQSWTITPENRPFDRSAPKPRLPEAERQKLKVAPMSPEQGKRAKDVSDRVSKALAGHRLDLDGQGEAIVAAAMVHPGGVNVVVVEPEGRVGRVIQYPSVTALTEAVTKATAEAPAPAAPVPVQESPVGAEPVRVAEPEPTAQATATTPAPEPVATPLKKGEAPSAERMSSMSDTELVEHWLEAKKRFQSATTAGESTTWGRVIKNVEAERDKRRAARGASPIASSIEPVAPGPVAPAAVSEESAAEDKAPESKPGAEDMAPVVSEPTPSEPTTSGDSVSPDVQPRGGSDYESKWAKARADMDAAHGVFNAAKEKFRAQKSSTGPAADEYSAAFAEHKAAMEAYDAAEREYVAAHEADAPNRFSKAFEAAWRDRAQTDTHEDVVAKAVKDSGVEPPEGFDAERVGNAITSKVLEEQGQGSLFGFDDFVEAPASSAPEVNQQQVASVEGEAREVASEKPPTPGTTRANDITFHKDAEGRFPFQNRTDANDEGIVPDNLQKLLSAKGGYSGDEITERPVIIWRDVKGEVGPAGRVYALDGHHRVYLAQHAWAHDGSKWGVTGKSDRTINTVEHHGDYASALEKAKLGNKASVPNTHADNARLARGLSDDGKTPKQVADALGIKESEAKKLIAFSHLHPESQRKLTQAEFLDHAAALGEVVQRNPKAFGPGEQAKLVDRIINNEFVGVGKDKGKASSLPEFRAFLKHQESMLNAAQQLGLTGDLLLEHFPAISDATYRLARTIERARAERKSAMKAFERTAAAAAKAGDPTTEAGIKALRDRVVDSKAKADAVAEKFSGEAIAARIGNAVKNGTPVEKEAEAIAKDIHAALGEETPLDAMPANTTPSVPASPRLPRELAGAKPRYGYGPRNFTLEFASDIDRAAFIVSQKTKSKRDADYRAFLRDNGLTGPELTALSMEVREAIKHRAKSAPTDSDHLVIPSSGKGEAGFMRADLFTGLLSDALKAVPKAARAVLQRTPKKQRLGTVDAQGNRVQTIDAQGRHVDEHASLYVPDYYSERAFNRMLAHAGIAGGNVVLTRPHAIARKAALSDDARLFGEWNLRMVKAIGQGDIVRGQKLIGAMRPYSTNAKLVAEVMNGTKNVQSLPKELRHVPEALEALYHERRAAFNAERALHGLAPIRSVGVTEVKPKNPAQTNALGQRFFRIDGSAVITEPKGTYKVVATDPKTGATIISTSKADIRTRYGGPHLAVNKLGEHADPLMDLFLGEATKNEKVEARNRFFEHRTGESLPMMDALLAWDAYNSTAARYESHLGFMLNLGKDVAKMRGGEDALRAGLITDWLKRTMLRKKGAAERKLDAGVKNLFYAKQADSAVPVDRKFAEKHGKPPADHDEFFAVPKGARITNAASDYRVLGTDHMGRSVVSLKKDARLWLASDPRMKAPFELGVKAATKASEASKTVLGKLGVKGLRPPGVSAAESEAMAMARWRHQVLMMSRNPADAFFRGMGVLQLKSVLGWNLRSMMNNSFQPMLTGAPVYGIRSTLSGMARQVGGAPARAIVRQMEARGLVKPADAKAWLDALHSGTREARMVGALQGEIERAHEGVGKMLGEEPPYAAVLDILKPMSGYRIIEDYTRGVNMLAVEEMAARMGLEPRMASTGAKDGTEEYFDEWKKRTARMKDPHTTEYLQAVMDSQTMFDYNDLGSIPIFGGALGKLFGRLTTFPANYIPNYVVNPVVGTARTAVAAARGVLSAVSERVSGKSFAAGPRKGVAETRLPAPEEHGNQYLVRGQYPAPQNAVDDFLERFGANYADRSEAGKFARQAVLMGAMYGILKGTGVNAFLMGTPGSEAILLLMLKAAYPDNEDIDRMLAVSKASGVWSPEKAARVGMSPTAQAIGGIPERVASGYRRVEDKAGEGAGAAALEAAKVAGEAGRDIALSHTPGIVALRRLLRNMPEAESLKEGGELHWLAVLLNINSVIRNEDAVEAIKGNLGLTPADEEKSRTEKVRKPKRKTPSIYSMLGVPERREATA